MTSLQLHGDRREVVTHPHPALSARGKPVNIAALSSTERTCLKGLVADMVETLIAKGGIGLAANQVFLRVFHSPHSCCPAGLT